MPAIRKLYTLDDIKYLLAKENEVESEDVNIFQIGDIQLDDGYGVFPVKGNDFLFQVDLNREDVF